jgi:hypothetical protein
VSNSQRTISITYLFLIGGSIASIWKNSTKKNPETNLIYLNVDLILITLPMMNVGSIIGVLIYYMSFLECF